jgi:RNA polymerase sigma-70 factor (ECF subfamily)
VGASSAWPLVSDPRLEAPEGHLIVTRSGMDREHAPQLHDLEGSQDGPAFGTLGARRRSREENEETERDEAADRVSHDADCSAAAAERRAAAPPRRGSAFSRSFPTETGSASVFLDVRGDTRELARLAQGGDRSAAAALWEGHRTWIAALLLAHRVGDSELEDLLHEVAAAMLGGLRELRHPEHFRPWLRRIAINVARDAGRRAEVRARHLGERAPVESLEEIGPGSTGLGAGDTVRTVLDLVRSLPEPYREVLLLRCVEELSQREIAATLDLPETTIETRLARARRMLRERAHRRDVGAPIACTGARPLP